MNQRTLLLLAFLPPLAAAAWVFWRVPALMRLYDSLAFELPLATAVLFRWRALIAFLPWLVVSGVAMLVPDAANTKGSFTLAMSVIVSVLVVAFAVWAGQLPMQDMASRL